MSVWALHEVCVYVPWALCHGLCAEAEQALAVIEVVEGAHVFYNRAVNAVSSALFVCVFVCKCKCKCASVLMKACRGRAGPRSD
jgi:hypothetical protein